MADARHIGVTVALLALAVARPSAGAPSAPKDTRPVLAVLSMNLGDGFTEKQSLSVEEVLLGALEDTGRFHVVGRTDVATMLDVQAKKQAAGCTDDTGCMTAIAGALGADYVASASLGRVGSASVLTFKVIDARKATVLVHAHETVNADADLIAACTSIADQVIDRVFGTPTRTPGSPSARETQRTSEEITPAPEVTSTAPHVHRSQVTVAVGQLTIAAKPRDGVRLDITTPSGKKITSGVPYENKQAEPGRWKVLARASGYEDVAQDIDVPPDDVAFARIELKLFGGLSITGTPAGAAVTVTGPGGFHDAGGLPWDASGLRSGNYQVKVTRDGYAASEQTVEVTPGGTTRVPMKLEKAVQARSGGHRELIQDQGAEGALDSKYVVNAETVLDRQMELTWQREVSPTTTNWAAAKAYCTSLELGGFTSGWRLPTKGELWSLVVRSSHPTIDSASFPQTPGEWFWTSSTTTTDGKDVWLFVNFGDGTYGSGTTGPTRVRCVR